MVEQGYKGRHHIPTLDSCPRSYLHHGLIMLLHQVKPFNSACLLEGRQGEGMISEAQVHGPISTPGKMPTRRASETSWGSGALSGHSSPKAFVLHIWTKTLEDRGLQGPGACHPTPDQQAFLTPPCRCHPYTPIPDPSAEQKGSH